MILFILKIFENNISLFVVVLLSLSRPPVNNHNHSDSPPTPTLDGIGSLDLVKILP
jgi:hypothetical protein